MDIVAAINDESDYNKNRNYWKYLKTKLKREENELVSVTHQLKLMAPDGKKRTTDVLDTNGVEMLAKNFPNTKATDFLDWFTYSDNTIDGQSRKKAYTLWGSDLVADKDVGKIFSAIDSALSDAKRRFKNSPNGTSQVFSLR